MSSDLHDLPADPSEKKVPPPSGGPLRWLILHTRGLIQDQHLRRVTMFYTVIGAMVMAFVSGLFLSGWFSPREHFYGFAIVVLSCGWLTIVSALLAIYDLLALRLQQRILRRALRARMLSEQALREERMKDEG